MTAAAATTSLDLDVSSYVRTGWLVVWVGVVGFLLWAALAPLDKGVIAPGTVVVSGHRKTIQHPGGGVIAEILVREGDTVGAGQILLRLDETQTRAEAESTRIQYLTAKAAEARLIAESEGATTLTFPKELLEARTHAEVNAAALAQEQLFASRRKLLTHELESLREVMAGTQAQMEGLRAANASKEAQRALLAEQLASVRDLSHQGFVPRNRLLEVERQHAEVDGAILDAAGRIGQLERQLLELRMRGFTLREEDRKAIGTELAQVRVDAESLGHKLRAAEHALTHINIRAPVAGTVVGLSVFTRGGTIAAGAPLMDIVPSGESLRVEAQVPVNLIDSVHAGSGVELSFVAFNQNRTPRVPAVIEHVSADRLIDEQSGLPYYRAYARVPDESLRRLHGLALRPGMPVEAFIKTGERSLLSYLFKPLADRAHTALTEE